MNGIRKPPVEYTFAELDRELIARGAQVPEQKRFRFKDKEGTPQRDCVVEQLKVLYDPDSSPTPDEALKHISTEELVKMLMLKAGKMGASENRGIWISDARVDYFDITDSKIRKNADSVLGICMKDDLIAANSRFSILKVKNYGKTFNLSDSEPFRHQPVSAGLLRTGFLVKKDLIATAGHCVDERKITATRFVFGFKMEEPYAKVTQVPNENIYKGVEIVRKVNRGRSDGSDWALVKLDRKVQGQTVARLSKKDIAPGQSVYVMGHPCGLPLKCAPGARIHDINEVCFGAHLDIYSGNSGSPVFNSKTHEVIGVVVRGDTRDFRWSGKGWVSVIYPNPDIKSKGAQCTRVSEFADIIDKKMKKENKVSRI